jgi:hypothetical protein
MASLVYNRHGFRCGNLLAIWYMADKPKLTIYSDEMFGGFEDPYEVTIHGIIHGSFQE